MDNKTDILASFNSPAIEKRLSKIRDRKGKNAFLESIMSNLNAEVLNETNGHKTILFSGNKGPKTITWEQTKQMAFELNEEGYDVAFLPELSEVLKLLNMDAGTFKSAIEYLLRNNLPFGEIILLNKYGKKIQLSKKRLPYLYIQEKDQRISIKKKREAFASLNLEPSDWNRYSARVGRYSSA